MLGRWDGFERPLEPIATAASGLAEKRYRPDTACESGSPSRITAEKFGPSPDVLARGLM